MTRRRWIAVIRGVCIRDRRFDHQRGQFAGCSGSQTSRRTIRADAKLFSRDSVHRSAVGRIGTLDASASNATGVEFYVNGADLGTAQATVYGWLYMPNGGQTWGWDTATVANGSYSITCVATSSDSQTGSSYQ